MKPKNIIITVFIAILVGLGVWFLKPKAKPILLLDYPHTAKVDPSLGLICETVVGSKGYGQNGAETSPYIYASLFEYKYQAKYEVKLSSDSKFTLSTVSGMSGSSDKWILQQNSDKYLVATINNFDAGDPYSSIFYLKKETGMALYIQSSANGLDPYSLDASYSLLKCM